MKLKIRITAFVLTAVICCVLCPSCAKQPAAMTYGKTEITEGMYSYWLSVYKTNFLYTYGDGNDSAEFWENTLPDGTTYAEYAEEQILRTIKFFAVGVELFREYGLKIDTDVSKQIDDDIQEKLDYAGSRPALNSELANFGLNIDGLKSVYIAEEKWQAVYDYLYGDSGIEKLTDESVDKYYRENFSCLGLIVVYTESRRVTNEDGTYVYDSDGNISVAELSQEEKNQQQQKIAEITEKLDSGYDFTELAEEYSEEDLSYYSGGCFVGSDNTNIYGVALVEAASEMKEGEVRRVDEGGITYIAVKYELPDRQNLQDSDKEQLDSLEEWAVQKVYYEKFSKLSEDVQINEEVTALHPLESAPLNTYY